MQKNKKIIQNLGRILIFALLIFELLNWSRILQYSVYFTWRGLVVTSVVCWLIIEIFSFILKRKYHTALSGWIYLAVAVTLYVDALGDLFGWYGAYAWYDQVAHFNGGFWLALIIWEVLRQFRTKLSFHGHLFFCWTTVLALGSLYEIEEYSEDLIFHSSRLGDAFDTVNDILMNGSGALLMLFIIWLIYRRVRSHHSSN